MTTINISQLKKGLSAAVLIGLTTFGIRANAQSTTQTQMPPQQTTTTNINNTRPQTQGGNNFAGDTVTYVLYNNDQNFDTKRTVVFDDKRTVDSLANALAVNSNKNYQIIYRKEGQQAKIITPKYLKTLDRSGFYQIQIAYNKPGVMDDARPMYIITSK
jgi:hypothetical protein